MTKSIREEIEKLCVGGIQGSRDGTRGLFYWDKLEDLFRSWALEERKEILGELVSAVGEKFVDYRPKPNVKYLAIKWDDLSKIITGLEEKQ